MIKPDAIHLHAIFVDRAAALPDGRSIERVFCRNEDFRPAQRLATLGRVPDARHALPAFARQRLSRQRLRGDGGPLHADVEIGVAGKVEQAAHVADGMRVMREGPAGEHMRPQLASPAEEALVRKSLECFPDRVAADTEPLLQILLGRELAADGIHSASDLGGEDFAQRGMARPLGAICLVRLCGQLKTPHERTQERTVRATFEGYSLSSKVRQPDRVFPLGA
jgi:hypothetical protein